MYSTYYKLRQDWVKQRNRKSLCFAVFNHLVYWIKLSIQLVLTFEKHSSLNSRHLYKGLVDVITVKLLPSFNEHLTTYITTLIANKVVLEPWISITTIVDHIEYSFHACVFFGRLNAFYFICKLSLLTFYGRNEEPL